MRIYAQQREELDSNPMLFMNQKVAALMAQAKIQLTWAQLIKRTLDGEPQFNSKDVTKWLFDYIRETTK